jgi:hypothetical protein
MTPAEGDPAKRHRVVLILWVAMFATLPMYFLVTRLVQPQSIEQNMTMVETLLGAALVCVVTSVVMRSRMAGESRTAQQVYAGYIVAFALSEAAGLFGVVTHFTTGWPMAWIFFVFGAAGFVLNFPQWESFERG